ncbi:helix-turn-helix domain-containing protein [Cohnella endophytica]|uniref:Helix-turn-helix domain-containing protein n=1 Tax=Cohnella endophytica TaxID=2419778 RepID=A0A494XE55_9BACL|nr:helix-turn-helix domain-containing protein [Cohnella endophytica]RKP48920.1 helix-turn-helix domain-containing protein [Cohnella endophytica]
MKVPLAWLRSASFSYRKNTYVKLLLSFIILNILNIFIVFGFYYLKSDQMMKQEIDRLSHKLLSQTQNVSNYVYTSTIKGVFDLYYDDSIYSALFSDDVLDVYDQHKLVTRLNRFLQTNPIVHSIYLYNMQLDVVVSTAYPNKKIEDFPDTEMTGVLQNFKYRSPKIPYLLRHSIPTKPRGTPTLSLIVTEPSSSTNRMQGAMIINIDDGQLQNLMTEMASDPINRMFIVQEDGQFVTDPKSDGLKDMMSRFRYYSDIQNAHKPSGTFIKSIDNEKYVIAFQKTNLESTGFIYVSVYPYSTLFRSLIQIRDITMLSSIFLIFVSLIVSVLISRKIYFPIRSLTQFARKQGKGTADPFNDGDIETIKRVFAKVIQDNESLEQVSARTKLLLRDQFLRSLLLGYEESRIGFRSWVKDHNIELIDAERLCVLIIRIDQYRMFVDRYDNEGCYLIRYAMRNIAEETLAEHCRSISVDIGSDHIAVILDSSALNEEALMLIAQEVQRNIKDYLKLSVTLGLGAPIESLAEAAFSYEGALSATHYRIFRGSGSLFMHEELFRHTKNEYPYDREKAIFDELKLGRQQKMKEAVEALLVTMDRNPSQDLFAILTQVILNIMKLIHAMPSKSTPLSTMGYDEIFNELFKLETKQEMGEWISQLLVQATADKEEKGRNAKSMGTIDKGVKYIEENYSRVDFSVTDVADRLRYSVSYLNKLFNDNLSYSVHEYINRMRLQKAIELIERSELLINDIAGLSGFSSSNYFYFVFKKAFGMTPNAYRKLHGQSETSARQGISEE